MNLVNLVMSSIMAIGDDHWHPGRSLAPWGMWASPTMLPPRPAVALSTAHCEIWLGLKENLQETGWFSEPNIK